MRKKRARSRKKPRRRKGGELFGFRRWVKKKWGKRKEEKERKERVEKGNQHFRDLYGVGLGE